MEFILSVIWASSVVTVPQSRRDYAQCWIGACWSKFWFSQNIFFYLTGPCFSTTGNWFFLTQHQNSLRYAQKLSSFPISHWRNSGLWVKAVSQIGLLLTEARISQTILPRMFFMCTTAAPSPSTAFNSFDWVGAACLPDPWVSTN